MHNANASVRIGLWKYSHLWHTFHLFFLPSISCDVLMGSLSLSLVFVHVYVECVYFYFMYVPYCVCEMCILLITP